MEKTAITAVCWLPCGKSRIRNAPAAEEDEAPEMPEEPAAAEGGGASGSAQPADGGGGRPANAGLEEFNMDDYDEGEEDGGMQFFSVLNADGELARGPDPYMQGGADSDSESDSFLEIGTEDKVFVAVSCEEDACNLELYIFDEEEASMFVHHDVMLGAYPLCVEWLNNAAGVGEGSFAAIGLIDHTIQIWDLDVLDVMEPLQMLGPKRKAKAKKKRGAPNPGGGGQKAHDGPVLCLHGSNFNRNVLVSGSADETVKVWDVSSNTCVHTYGHHSSKVQCARWHPTEQAVMLSAAFDRRLALLDVRQPGQAAMAPLPAEAESAIWRRHRPFECLASADNGGLTCYDVRKVANKAPEKEMVLWSIQAHEVACTSVQDCPTPDCLVTAGLDGSAKVWNSPGTTPKLVVEKNLKAGPLFACHSSAEAPALFCFGGKCPVMWDLTSEQLLTDVFKFEDTPGA
mmetsp:Transcript_65613/g.203108  ORF Transcript_65613/g.203108 Transcript_65613/m.203108 type:complete len:457 (+) Transcript_65613:127-1497(+)